MQQYAVWFILLQNRATCFGCPDLAMLEAQPLNAYHTIRTSQSWPSHVGALHNCLRSTAQCLPHDSHQPVLT